MRLREKYQKEVMPALMEELGIKNKMSVPRIVKVSVACSFGKTVQGKTGSEKEKIEEHILSTLNQIVGQKPCLRKAKKSIAAFKLREGTIIGVLSTLRGERAHQFLEKVLYIALPRKRDFRGIPLKSISDEGNLTIGFKEYAPFPEVKIEREKGIFGFEVSITTTAKSKKEAEMLFRLMGFPLEKIIH